MIHDPAPLAAGCGKVDITPPIGALLAGSLFPREAKSIKFPLYVRCLALRTAEGWWALVTLDLLVLERDFIDLIKARIERRIGIPMGRLTVCCSHTHSGPYTTPLFGGEPVDWDYMQTVVEAALEAVNQAVASMQPAQVGFGTTIVRDVAFNSRLKLKDGSIAFWGKPAEEDIEGTTGPVDPQVSLLAFTDHDEKPIALVYNVNCHTNTDSSREGEAISADYPGFASEIIERQWGGMALFTLGSCGDVHPDYSLGSQVIGERIGSAVSTATATLIDYDTDPRLSVTTAEVRLKLRADPRFRKADVDRVLSQKTFPPEMRDPIIALFAQEAEGIARLKRAGDEVTTLLQVIRLGTTDLVCVPGELFTEYGQRIKGASQARHSLIIELSNDWVGYIPTLEAHQLGGYQTWTAYSSKLEIEAGERITQEVIRMLDRL